MCKREEVETNDAGAVKPHHPDDVSPDNAHRWQLLSVCLGGYDWLHLILDLVVLRCTDDFCISRRHDCGLYGTSQVDDVWQTEKMKIYDNFMTNYTCKNGYNYIYKLIILLCDISSKEMNIKTEYHNNVKSQLKSCS